jgi:hypothetical protein
MDITMPRSGSQEAWHLNLSLVNIFSGVDHEAVVAFARRIDRSAVARPRTVTRYPVFICPENCAHGSVVHEKMRKLFRSRKEIGRPVVIVTHSETVLYAVRRAVLAGDLEHEDVRLYHLISADGVIEQIVRPLIDSRGNIDDWPDGFFDQSDKDMDALLDWDKKEDVMTNCVETLALSHAQATDEAVMRLANPGEEARSAVTIEHCAANQTTTVRRIDGGDEIKLPWIDRSSATCETIALARLARPSEEAEKALEARGIDKEAKT